MVWRGLIELKEMKQYRTITYLDGFEIKYLVLEQDYIDFNMREKFTDYSLFIESELRHLVDLDFRWHDYDYLNLAICIRPYIVGCIKIDDVLRRYIDNRGNLVEYPMRKRDGGQKYFAGDLYETANRAMEYKLLQLQNRGIKTRLKKLHYDKSNEMVLQLLNEKIKHHETH